MGIVRLVGLVAGFIAAATLFGAVISLIRQQLNIHNVLITTITVSAIVLVTILIKSLIQKRMVECVS